jgi:hypothetical protein
MEYLYTLCLGGHPVRCSFSFLHTAQRCRPFACERPSEEKAVQISEIDKNIFFSAYPDERWGPEAENKLLIMLVSDALLPSDRMLFHSAAVLWMGKAWLITSPSGTGKTTQLRNMKKLCGSAVQAICGDNPVLHFMENGPIMVHPSPWNGKENYGGGSPAPLAGIIYLRQAGDDRIERLAPEDAVVPFFQEMNTFSRTPEAIRKILSLEEKLITSVPLWQFRNTGTLESTALLVKTLREYAGKDGQDDL